ncbi:MAG: GNAT family N-acetyltransferase [Bdellovibrio sp.]|nr:MAG: GNAT family N-acetyltransferase [Bdellovibrio sp.]
MIRPLSSSDNKKALAIFMKQSWPGSASWSKESLEEELKQAKSLGYFKDQQLLAFLLYRQVFDEVEITLLLTDPVFEGQGLMTTLLASFVSCPLTIFLEVHEKNHKALMLYQKFHFQQIHRRTGYYSDGGDALVLKKEKSRGCDF